MTLNKKGLNFYRILLLSAIILIVSGCANVQRPQGGPRDRNPPKLLKATPPNMTRNFSAKSIELQFDEFFKLANQYQEITISPAQEKQPEYKIRKKSLIIDFKDTLHKNTTYVINFGKGITDVNEGNVMKNFTYVFSTGTHIDSLSMSGTVTNSITLEKEKDVTVMLYPLKQDTLFGKKKPSIFATTDTSGNFSLNNLHDGAYKIYALKEASPNKIFDNDNELVAFLKKPIQLFTDTTDIQLTLFKQTPEKFRLIERRFDLDGKMIFVFNKSLNNPAVRIIYPAELDKEKIAYFSNTKDSAQVFMRNMDFDSIRVAFLDNNKPLDTIALKKGRKETFQRQLTFQFNVGSDAKLKPGSDLLIKANIPIENFDAPQITLAEDSTPVNNYTLIKDTANAKNLVLKYRWKQNVKYSLNINENAITDIYGDKNKKTAGSFQVDKPENYSTLTLKIKVPDTTKSYVVEFYREQKNILSSIPIRKSTSLVYKNYLTSKYRVRVIYDDNKNGKWDSGNVKQQKQPENIWIYEKEISLRPNWEAEEAISIPPEPTTP